MPLADRLERFNQVLTSTGFSPLTEQEQQGVAQRLQPPLHVAPHVMEFLFQVEQGLKRHGHRELDEDMLRTMAQHLSQPQIAQAIATKQLSPAYVVQEVLKQVASRPGADPDEIGMPQPSPKPEPGNPEPDPLKGLM